MNELIIVLIYIAMMIGWSGLVSYIDRKRHVGEDMAVLGMIGSGIYWTLVLYYMKGGI